MGRAGELPSAPGFRQKPFDRFATLRIESIGRTGVHGLELGAKLVQLHAFDDQLAAKAQLVTDLILALDRLGDLAFMLGPVQA